MIDYREQSMTARDAKKFIGKRVEYWTIGDRDPHRGTRSLGRIATVLAVKGRNIQTSDDWLWAPNVTEMREYQKPKEE